MNQNDEDDYDCDDMYDESNDDMYESEKDEEAKVTSISGKSSDILHNLTLELMINKRHYKRVLEKTDNKKFQQMNDDDNKIQYHFEDIMSITKELLRNHNNPKYGNEMTLSFTVYLQNCLNHMENERDVYKETDVIFESLNEKSTYIPSNVANCWGKPIKKMVN
jgi:hypothetical protein